MNSFKLKGLKSYLIAALAAILLGGAVTGVAWYAFSDNPPAELAGVDDTTWLTVARNSDIDSPTRENPVWIEVSVERLYGLHIGTPMRVRYKIVALNSVKMQFETLERGILSRYKTTWREVKPMKRILEESKEGYTTRIIELTVAVWEPPSLPESVPQGKHTDFLLPPASPVRQQAATSASKTPPPPMPAAASPDTAAAAPGQAAAPAPDGSAQAEAAPAGPVEARLWPMTAEFVVSTGNGKNGLRRWQYIETPPVNFGFSSLLEPDADQHGLEFGPMAEIPAHDNRLGVALYYAGHVITVGGIVYLGVLFFGWWRRRKLPRPIPEEVVRYRQSMEAAERAKHVRSHLEQVRIAVREFLGGATLHDEDLTVLWAEHPEHEKVDEVLGVLKSAVSEGRLNVLEERKVADVMDSLVEDRLAVKVVETRWSRPVRKFRASVSGITRFFQPVRQVTKLPIRLRQWWKRRRT